MMTPMAESPAATPAADSRVRKSSIESAVNALLKHKATQSSTQKLQLLPGDDYIYLNLSLKKIPSQPRTNPYRIPLPHPILDASSQLCLIVDDRPKSTTPPSDEIKKLIKSQDIPISKVIKISKLKTNYKPFEAKRKLCDSYDLFLVDKRVVHLLPKLIGKQFFKKKKLPLGVDLTKKNLKLKVEMTLGSALMYVRSGTCCVMKVGKVEMEKDEVVENVFDAIKGAVERVPKKWDGVRSLHLKFSDSVALPIYQAMPDLKLKIEGLKDREEEGDEGMKMSDNDGDVKEVSEVKDAKSGKKKKGRIHEVNYMDIGEGIVSDDDGIENVEETLMDEEKKTEKEEFDADETVGKKRKASKKGNAEKNVGKKSKKIESSDNDDIENVEEKLMDEGKKKKNVGKKPKKIESDGNDDVEIVQEKMMDEGKKKTLGKKLSPLKNGKAEKIVGEKSKKKESSRKEEVAELVSKRSERIAKKTEEIAELVSKRSERIAKKRVSAK